MSNQHPLCRQVPAVERAAIVEREIRAAIDSGEFEFVQGYLKRVQKFGEKTCLYGGCAIAALAYVVGSRASQLSASSNSVTCQDAAVDSGLVTRREAMDLEGAYEGGEVHGPFGAVGVRLRNYAEARGGRYALTRYDNATSEPFFTIER